MSQLSKLPPSALSPPKARVSNQQRAESNVGLEVDPMQVRLLPEPQDGYAWSACPERQHLFLRPLSKHSVSAYRELDKEVGKSFEAIKPPLKSPTLEDNPHTGFTAQIFRLQEQNEKLTEEVERFKTLAGTEVTLRQQREDMDKTLEHSAKEAKSKLRTLSEEKMRLQRQVKRLTRRLNRSESPTKAEVDSSFTRHIIQLQSDNTNLSTELARLTALLQESIIVRKQLEETVTKHKTDTSEVHERTRRTQEENTKLQQENAKLLGHVRRLQRSGLIIK